MGFFNHDPRSDRLAQGGQPLPGECGLLTSLKIRLSADRIYHPIHGWVWVYKDNYYKDVSGR